MSKPLDDTMPATDDTVPATARGGALPAQISRFEIESKLGEGGNGVVWLARDPLLDRKVAIKVLRSNDNADASQRLLREAQSAAKLVHENIIVVHDVGMAEGRAYVAMEYVAGMPLGRWQSNRHWREIVKQYIRAGRGLGAAHAAGFVHRDFKPDNVLVGDDGRVRVTDFGLVSVDGIEVDEDRASVALDVSLTHSGAIMGTPRYMAPEQHQAAYVDARADQFAFCAALYEALFGQAPFAGDTYSELAKNVCDGALRAPPANGDVPSAVRDALARGLSRKREDRFDSMTVLLDVLAASVHAPRRKRWPLLVGVALCLAGVGVWWFFLRAKPDPVREAFDHGQAAYERGDYLTAADDFRRALRLDPDMKNLGEVYIFNIGAALDQAGDCVGARTMYERYLVVAKNANDKERARIEKRLAILGDCSDAEVAYRAGEAAYEQGDFKTAVEQFKRGFALAPDISKHALPYLFNMAQAYRQMDNCKEAFVALQKYVGLGGRLPESMRPIMSELEACASASR